MQSRPNREQYESHNIWANLEMITRRLSSKTLPKDEYQSVLAAFYSVMDSMTDAESGNCTAHRYQNDMILMEHSVDGLYQSFQVHNGMESP